MRRPSLRIPLVLALVAGVAAIASRVRRGRDAALPVAPAPSTTWPPLEERTVPPPAAAPEPAAAPTTTAEPAPTAAPASTDAAPPDAPAPAMAPAPPTAATSAPAPSTPLDEDDTDPKLFVGVPDAGDDRSLQPEPEAVLPEARIEDASAHSALIADRAGDDVPPPPEPTFGTAPDPAAAATAPVPVATPVELEPDEPLPVPQRGGTTHGNDLSGTDPSGTDPSAAAPRAGAGLPADAASPAGSGEADTARWIPPVAGACAPSHPVKAKLTSRIFHLPGMVDYERTSPDRCYLDAAAAEADGLRAAKR